MFLPACDCQNESCCSVLTALFRLKCLLMVRMRKLTQTESPSPDRLRFCTVFAGNSRCTITHTLPLSIDIHQRRMVKVTPGRRAFWQALRTTVFSYARATKSVGQGTRRPKRLS